MISTDAGGAVVAATPIDDLRSRVGRYLQAHHTMTIATMGPPAEPRPGASAPTQTGGDEAATLIAPHAASVFYAVDDEMRLVFLSKPISTHGSHIGAAARVAVTVAEHYDDWEAIQGVQLWGTARRLRGAAKAAAMAVYLRRFPFVKELLEQPRLAELAREMAIYRVEPERVAFTDNTTGVFGREVLNMKGR